MGKTCRVQKGKKWAMQNYELPWFPCRLVGAWRAAAESPAEGGREALGKAIAAASKMEHCVALRDVLEPRPAEEAERLVKELRLEKRKTLEAQDASREEERNSPFGILAWLSREKKISECSPEELEKRIDWAITHREEESARFARTSEAFIKMPSTSWTMRFGDAQLFDFNEASDMIRLAVLAKELSGVLDQAMAEAEALGFKVPTWLLPSGELGKDCILLSSASAVEFDPADEFEEKACYAVYVDGSPGGFLDKKGRVKNDLGEACLFPAPKDAKAFAKKHAASCFLVNVQASVTGCKALLGEGSIPDSLTAVIASRERREISEALGKAEIEMLKEELARRESAEPKQEAAPRSTRRL